MFDSWTRLWTICGDPRSGGWPRAKISNIKQLDLSPGRVPEKSFSFYIHKPKGKINCDRKKKRPRSLVLKNKLKYERKILF
jgi:hypothetical protein